jgi:DNA-binding CsgD family transcriptional regulator
MTEIKKTKMRKREKVVAIIAEALGDEVVGSEVMSLTDMSAFPNLEKESKRNLSIMALVANGLSERWIADSFKVSQPTINEIINRIDPDKQFRVSKQARLAFKTQLLEMRGMEALLSITPEKLKDSSAKDLASIGKVMFDAAGSLNQSKHGAQVQSKLEIMMNAANAEAEDAEFEVLDEAG